MYANSSAGRWKTVVFRRHCRPMPEWQSDVMVFQSCIGEHQKLHRPRRKSNAEEDNVQNQITGDLIILF